MKMINMEFIRRWAPHSPGKKERRIGIIAWIAIAVLILVFSSCSKPEPKRSEIDLMDWLNENDVCKDSSNAAIVIVPRSYGDEAILMHYAAGGSHGSSFRWPGRPYGFR